MAKNNIREPGPASTILISALQHMLRPLVRLLLANGIGYTTVIEILKSIYVRVADEEFRIAGKAQTDSRISLLTGVHRKDVKRLRGETSDGLRQPEAVSLSAQLFARWTGAQDYLDDSGNPRPLPRLAAKADGPSFESLVASVSKDIRARAVLDEWLRLGAAELDLEDNVRLNAEAFIPRKGFEEKVFYFGHNMHDHMAAVAHNLMGGSPPCLERCVYYGQLGDESVRELAGLAQKAGMQALQAVNRRAMVLQAEDAGKPVLSKAEGPVLSNAEGPVLSNAEGPGPRQRMTFGIYFYGAGDTTETVEKP